jgi:hypothetical protein
MSEKHLKASCETRLNVESLICVNASSDCIDVLQKQLSLPKVPLCIGTCAMIITDVLVLFHLDIGGTSRKRFQHHA